MKNSKVELYLAAHTGFNLSDLNISELTLSNSIANCEKTTEAAKGNYLRNVLKKKTRTGEQCHSLKKTFSRRGTNAVRPKYVSEQILFINGAWVAVEGTFNKNLATTLTMQTPTFY